MPRIASTLSPRAANACDALVPPVAASSSDDRIERMPLASVSMSVPDCWAAYESPDTASVESPVRIAILATESPKIANAAAAPMIGAVMMPPIAAIRLPTLATDSPSAERLLLIFDSSEKNFCVSAVISTKTPPILVLPALMRAFSSQARVVVRFPRASPAGVWPSWRTG